MKSPVCNITTGEGNEKKVILLSGLIKIVKNWNYVLMVNLVTH